MNLRTFMTYAEENNGGSYCILTGESNPKNGYMVSVGTEGNYDSLNHENMREFISLNTPELFRPDRYFGIWRNGDTWTFDVSINLADLDKARKTGKKHSQKAIWDCENGCEIFL